MNWAKKLVLAAGLTVLGGACAFGAAQWVGNGAISVNGTWYYSDNALGWCTGGAFASKDLGTVGTDSFTLGGQVQLYDEAGANWGQGTAYMYYSIDGGTAVQTSLTYYKFENSNNFFQSGGSTFAAGTIDISGLSSGTSHTLAIYFKDIDGRKTTTTVTATFQKGAVVLDTGNVWHIPSKVETWSVTMRDPLEPGDGASPFLRLGNQSNAQDQWMTGANIKYRVGTSGAWSSIPMGWEQGAGSGEYEGNAYWSNAIPTVSEGQTVQYYFEAEFANSQALGTTYVYTTNNGAGCVKSVTEADAQANPFSFTVSAHVYNLGNCWHIPANAEPAGTYMRNPTHPYASSDVWIYNGNQDSGEGNPGNQNGGVVYYRKAGTTAWSETNMWFDAAIENNKYWHSRIPANAFSDAESVEYVIKVTYENHDDTYLALASAGAAVSATYGTLEAAAVHPFDFTYAGQAGQEPGFVWHGGNAVKLSGTNVQLWVKTGYIVGSEKWADQAQIRYKVVVPAQASSTDRQGVRAIPRKKGARAVDPELTETVEMRFDHAEEDASGIGQAMWWVGNVQSADLAVAGAKLRYQIAVRRTTAGGGNNTWRLAEYQSGGANDQVFEYTMASSGANTLTVNGLNADYTTSKFFIDESKGETAHLHVVYSPPSGATDVQIFSNVGRRDYWGADLNGDGVADAIRPPSGDLVTTANTATTNTYFGAWAMTWDADAGVWTWDADIGKTGAYRLTARYKVAGDANWHYYSALGSGIRDHAIVISPKKVLQQNVYEVNGMTAKASAPTEEGHSTFDDLIEGADGYAEFGVPYLNNIGANCLWFQPIHTSSEYGLAEGGEPGSPYAAKDYFTVSKWYGKSRTTAGALEEFQHFVAACDAGSSPGMRASNITSKVGTINIMLDGVFNHTSWDAVFGVMGERMGIVPAGQGATTAIASVKPGWYANCSDYGAPATWYRGPEGGNHDIASGPDRGDFGKWLDTAELFYGNYSALVRHNPDDNGNYLNEDDQYDYTSMTTNTEALWEYMGSYVPYWLDQTGHDFGNERMGQTDANGTAYDDYGIDGLRCDFGQGLPPQFWEYCINRARAKKWNFMFMAESLDGGKVSYRSNRHFDILNESFVFAARNAGNPSDLLAVTDDKKAAYNGGAVLLNLTSHDEVMPYSDPWKTASRYAMLATVKGLPMTMYGQEQGIVPLASVEGNHKEGDIVMPNAPWTGFAKFELNFGKWVADFKTWNKLTIWEQPAMDSFESSRGMAQLYGRINRARQGSPALQSDVQWMLPFQGSENRSGDIWAMAKAEDYGALSNGKDAVLAFVLFVNDTHYAQNATFGIPAGAASMLGLEAGESYTARNLAAANPEQVLWTNTTEQLTGEGVWVNFTADQNGSAFYNDGAMVYFLKLEKAVAPVTHDITVTVGANGSVSPNGTVTVDDGEDQEFVITAAAGYRIESVLADGVAVATFDNSSTTYTYTWTNVTAGGTLEATFAPRVWTINATAGANGSVTPSGAVSVNEGDSQTFTITAASGYRIASVTKDGVAVATFDNSSTNYIYTWSNVTADGTLAATFTPRVWTITATAGSNGSILPSGEVVVNEGASQTFTVTAASGYRISSLLADDVSVGTFGNDDTSYTYTWENVTADGTLTAAFVEQTSVPADDPVSTNGVTVSAEWLDGIYGEGNWSPDTVNEMGDNGYTVWQSYIAGLDPTDPTSELKCGDDLEVNASTGAVGFKVEVLPHRIATVEYIDDLVSGTWQVKTSWTNTGDSASMETFSDGDSNSRRFYRVKLKMAE